MGFTPETQANKPGNYVDIDSPFLSSTFKIWIVGLIFFMVFMHLFALITFPGKSIISDKFILGLALLLIGYLWTQELRDRYRLQQMNQTLLEAQRKLEEAEIDTITSLILMEEAKDPYVHGHSGRVAKFSVAMGDALNYSQDTKEIIRRAALLHDMGKLIISDDVLLKPEKLNDEEWEVIKQHPQKAVDILEPLRFLHLEKKIILHHHERVDGLGYPKGLKDQEIPLESRIIAIADSFDAMNSARIYREPCTKEFILTELRKVAGTQLDADLITVFLRLLEENPWFWERT